MLTVCHGDGVEKALIVWMVGIFKYSPSTGIHLKLPDFVVQNKFPRKICLGHPSNRNVYYRDGGILRLRLAGVLPRSGRLGRYRHLLRRHGRPTKDYQGIPTSR